jgi:hypothetical protein
VDFRPSVVEELEFVVTADELCRGVLDDAGDVGLEACGGTPWRHGVGWSLMRRDETLYQRLNISRETRVLNGGDLVVKKPLHTFWTGFAELPQIH